MRLAVSSTLRALLIAILLGVPVGKILLTWTPPGVAILGACIVAILFAQTRIFPMEPVASQSAAPRTGRDTSEH